MSQQLKPISSCTERVLDILGLRKEKGEGYLLDFISHYSSTIVFTQYLPCKIKTTIATLLSPVYRRSWIWRHSSSFQPGLKIHIRFQIVKPSQVQCCLLGKGQFYSFMPLYPHLYFTPTSFSENCVALKLKGACMQAEQRYSHPEWEKIMGPAEQVSNGTRSPNNDLGKCPHCSCGQTQHKTGTVDGSPFV